MIFLEPYRKYAMISGRATRREFWAFGIFLCAITPFFLVADYFLFPDDKLLTLIFSLFSTIPSFTVTFRRLHDTDRSAWWFLVGSVPFIGFLFLIYFLSLDSTPGINRFGKQPRKIYTPRSFVLQLVFWFAGLLLVVALWLIVGFGYLGNPLGLGDFLSDEAFDEILEQSSDLPTNGAGLKINEDPQLEYRNGVMYLQNHEEPYAGQYVSWWENGQKKKEGTYKGGEQDGLWTDWYENGQKESESTFTDGNENGLFRKWDENGQNMIDGNYKGGKEDGLWTYWLERKEGTYKDGKEDGLWTWWDDQGNPTKETHYKNGEEVF